MITEKALEQRLISSGIVNSANLKGCSLDDVRSIESAAKVTLPATYVAFMRVLGRNAGNFFCDIDYSYPIVITLNERAQRILDNWENGLLKLPPHAFVFALRQGEQFMFFVCDGNDDPEISFYIEGAGCFAVCAKSLWDVVVSELEQFAEFKKSHPQSTFFDLSFRNNPS